jgi:hypothetical protein
MHSSSNPLPIEERLIAGMPQPARHATAAINGGSTANVVPPSGDDGADPGGAGVVLFALAAARASVAALTWREVARVVVVVLVAWFLNSLMLFAMNFTLNAFTNSRAASYTTLLASSAAFFALAVVALAAVFVAAHATTAFASGKRAFANLVTWSHVSGLAVLGLVDALGGVLGTYAAPNTPIAVQMTIIATGVAWTFPAARVLTPDRQRRCAPVVALAVGLTIVGAVVTIIPQWDSMSQLRGAASSIGWIAVYFGAGLFPLILNILYARYLIGNVDAVGQSVILPRVASAGGNTCAQTDNGGSRESGGDVHHGTSRHRERDGPVSGAAVSVPAAAAAHGADAEYPARLQSETLDDVVPRAGDDAASAASTAAASASELVPQVVAADRNWPFFVAKLSIALFGDGLFQLLFILVMLPLDFCPWFGAAASPAQSWNWLQSGFVQIGGGSAAAGNGTSASSGSGGGRPVTGAYLALYSLGFFGAHAMGAALSYYSPQLCAFIFAVNIPINLLLLALLPSWNVFGLVTPTWASASSIVVTAAGAMLYAAWEHQARREEAATLADSAS